MAQKEQTIIVLEENEKVMRTYEHIALQYEVEIRDVIAMKNVAFPDIDAQHFMVAMSIAKKYDLDPSVKEIYGWEKGWRVTVVASNAWFLKIARKQDWYIKIISNAVFPEDEFEMDMLNDEIKKHVIHPEKRDKESVPLGAYAILKMKDQPDQVKWVDWTEYVQTWDYSPWRKQKSAMISKCATSVLCREAFGLSGLYGEEEMEQESFEDKKKKANNVMKTLKEAEKITSQEQSGPEEWVIAEVEETPESPKEDTPYKDKMISYFMQCVADQIEPLVPAPTNLESYTEKQAKKDSLLLDQTM